MRLIKKFYNYYLSPDKGLARSLHNSLGVMPVTLEFYRRAFIHRSVAKESTDTQAYNNERLEYLGDAVLGVVIAEYLFKKYPYRDEGFLTRLRSNIVNRKTLNDLAQKLSLEVFLKQQGLVQITDSMMGNALEAFLGALYLDHGMLITRRFIINRMVKQHLNIKEMENMNNNFKSILLEFCQRQHQSISYELVQQFKRNNRDCFRVAVLIDRKPVAEAEDYNKKSAEQIASQAALRKLGVLLPKAKADY